MGEIFLIKQSLEKLMADYDKQAYEVEESERAYLTAKTSYDLAEAKKSIELKLEDPKESATDRKHRVLVALEKELIYLTSIEATFRANETKLKAIENRKQLVRDQCKLASAETYAGHLTGQDSVSKKSFR